MRSVSFSMLLKKSNFIEAYHNAALLYKIAQYKEAVELTYKLVHACYGLKLYDRSDCEKNYWMS